MTSQLQTLRAISRQLYAEPAKPFVQARPVVRPSDYFGRYSKITSLPRIATK